jgi:hypothetical protein
MVQHISIILTPNDYFAGTINSCVDVATYSDSVLAAAASNYSDVLVHACHNSEYAQKSMSTMHSGISNIQHAPAYSHSLAIEQIHMPMNNYHDQTSIIYPESFHEASYICGPSNFQCGVYPESFHEASYICGPSNFQCGVSSFYLSVENSHCINRSRHMPMDEKIGKFNSNHQANYFECSYATPYVVEKEVTRTCSSPYTSCNFHDSAPYVSNDYS